MSYAIIRNEKYTRDEMNQLSPHNERNKKKYSNQNIDRTKSHLNYHLKKPKENTYYKEFQRLQKENNLTGQIHKNSIYACEIIITSDKTFFDKIGQKETKRYFQTAYNFISNYNNLGSENIISAVVHLDEETPHMHLVYIPVVHTKDSKSGKDINKISCYEFWRGKNSYRILQDKFYNCVRENGFNLERGDVSNRTHIKTEKLKGITNYNQSKDKIQKLEEIKKYYEEYISTMYNITNILFDFPVDSMEHIVKKQMEENNKNLRNICNKNLNKM